MPSILTIGIFIWGFKFIQDNISIHINRGIVELIMYIRDYSGQGAREGISKFWVHGLGSIAGFLVALVAVCIIGAILASVVGKTLWRMVEKFLVRTPFLRRVYPYIKQITDFLLTQNKKEQLFLRVVAVEYPKKGIWSIGLVTGDGIKKVNDNIKKEFLTILIPTSPTPFTGFVIMAPKKQTIELDMSVEEAMRFIVSGGVITPSTKLDEHKVEISTLPQKELKDEES